MVRVHVDYPEFIKNDLELPFHSHAGTILYLSLLHFLFMFLFIISYFFSLSPLSSISYFIFSIPSFPILYLFCLYSIIIHINFFSLFLFFHFVVSYWHLFLFLISYNIFCLIHFFLTIVKYFICFVPSVVGHLTSPRTLPCCELMFFFLFLSFFLSYLYLFFHFLFFSFFLS